MGLPYIPGWFDQLAPSIDKFTTGLQKAMYPNFEQEEAVRKQMLDPAFLQQIGDFNAQNPGVLQQIPGFAKFANQFSGVQQSTKSKIDSKINQQLADPTKADEIVQRAGGAQTDAQRKQQDLQTTSLEQGVQSGANRLFLEEFEKELAPLMAAGKTAEIGDAMAGITRRMQGRSLIPQVQAKVPKGSNVYLAGKQGLIPQEELELALNDPEFRKTYDNFSDEYWNQDRSNLARATLDAQKEGTNPQEIVKRAMAGVAAKIAETTRLPFDANKMVEAMLGQGTIDPNTPEGQAYNAYRKAATDEKRTEAYNEFNKVATPLRRELLKLKKPSDASAANVILEQLNDLGVTYLSEFVPPAEIKRMVATVNDGGWFGKEFLEFKPVEADPMKAMVDEQVLKGVPRDTIIMQIQQAQSLSGAQKQALLKYLSEGK
jgi:hypothetical protein